MCIGVNAQKLATVTHCQRASQWVYDPQSKTIKDLRSGLCMSVFDLSGQYRVKMVKCNPSDEFQQFTYTFYKKSGLKYSEIVWNSQKNNQTVIVFFLNEEKNNTLDLLL